MEEQHLFGNDSGSQSSSGSETLSEGEGIQEEHQYDDDFNDQHASDFETIKAEGKEEEKSVADDEVETVNKEYGEEGDDEMVKSANV